MATLSKLDAYNARARDALILPFKRKIASLTIRTDIWKSDLDRVPAAATNQDQTRALATEAINEVDHQVELLADLKLPGEKKARSSEAEVKSLLEGFAAMRLMLVGMAGRAATA